MNYPVYNPYLYNSMGMQQAQQGPFMPQQINQSTQIQGASQGQQQAIQGLSPASRPVTSKEEAMGVAADFSGALMMFPDITHNRVYIKRWNYQSGAADFVEFAPVIPAPAQEEPQNNQAAFASIQDLQDLQNVVDNLRQELERLKKPQATAAKAPVKKEKGDASE